MGNDIATKEELDMVFALAIQLADRRTDKGFTTKQMTEEKHAYSVEWFDTRLDFWVQKGYVQKGYVQASTKSDEKGVFYVTHAGIEFMLQPPSDWKERIMKLENEVAGLKKALAQQVKEAVPPEKSDNMPSPTT